MFIVFLFFDKTQQAVYLFKDGIFPFASGYFFKESSLTHKWDFTKKRIKGLYIPYLKYGLIFLILHNLFFHLNIYNGEYGFEGRVSSLYTWSDFLKRAVRILTFEGTESLLGSFWFLRSLFISSLMFCFIYWGISRFFRSHTKIYLFTFMSIIYIAGTWMSYKEIHLPRYFEREMTVCGIFYLGYLYHNNFFVKQKQIRYNLPFIVMSFALLISATFIGKIELSVVFITNPLFFTITTFLGCYMIMGISNYVLRFKTLKNIISYMGNHTLEILTFHCLAFKIVSLLKIGYYDWDIARLAEFPVIQESNTFWWILYTLVGISIPLGIPPFTKWITSSFRKICTKRLSIG